MPYRPRMDDITDDERMAEAVGDVAFHVLTLLANNPDRRNEFLRAFLALAVTYGGGQMAMEALKSGGH